jgi:hypothetical protein
MRSRLWSAHPYKLVNFRVAAENRNWDDRAETEGVRTLGRK